MSPWSWPSSFWIVITSFYSITHLREKTLSQLTKNNVVNGSQWLFAPDHHDVITITTFGSRGMIEAHLKKFLQDVPTMSGLGEQDGQPENLMSGATWRHKNKHTRAVRITQKGCERLCGGGVLWYCSTVVRKSSKLLQDWTGFQTQTLALDIQAHSGMYNDRKHDQTPWDSAGSDCFSVWHTHTHTL